MRAEAPFQPDDLEHLDTLLSRADRVVPMREIAAGDTAPGVLGLRHDVDNVIAPAVAMAEWEAERGYRSTYFILPTAPYWRQKEMLEESLHAIADCGHEIGYHLNAVTAAIETGRPVHEIIEETVGELRGYGFPVTGVVAHGDQACYRHNFINDEIWLESPRPSYGAPDRVIAGSVRLAPVPRETFGFTYDPNWLPRAEYLSDSGGRWSRPFDDVAEGFPYGGQLHMLVHADHWPQAFPNLAVAA